jgi:hypothetical protein
MLSLAQSLTRSSTTRLVVVTVCHPDLPLVPCPNQLNEFAKISSLPSSFPACPFIVVYITAATDATATTMSLPRLVATIEHHLGEPSSPMLLYTATTVLLMPSSPPAHLIISTITTHLIVSIQLAADTVTAVAAAFTTTARQLFTIQFTAAKATTAASDDITMTTHQIFTIPLHAAT